MFVQSKTYIPNFAHIMQPLNELTRKDKVKGNPVPFLWTPAHQHAFDTIRNHLLDGAHLAPPHYGLPFHCGGDASNDGKAFGIHQYNDLPAGTNFTVTSHTTTTTTVSLPDGSSHTITHTDHNRKNIAWFSKCWTEAERKCAPF